MTVRSLSFEGYRNLHPGQFEPEPGVNILTGENGQGKTNLLEACWLFTGARSFRGAKDSELVGFDAEEAKLGLRFFAGGREQEAAMSIKKRRSATLNGSPLSSPAKLSGVFCGVVFFPAHLSLVREGPEERRRFVDGAYCQIKPAFVGILADYQKILAQRNAFLKQKAESGVWNAGDEEMLDLWDNSLAVSAAKVTVARRAYIKKLAPMAKEVYAGLSGDRETMDIAWCSPVGDCAPAELAEAWLAELTKSRKLDKATGFTTAGPHRDDLSVLLDGHPAKVYGSQGQQRSAVLALKMAEASLLQEVTDEPPVAFLDDVMSELDVSRQDYILNRIRDWQVFITCCEPTAPLRLTAGKCFTIKQGVISE